MADSRVGLTIEEVLDRVEINDLLVRYCAALRTKDLTLLDEVFSPDAMIDYTRIGGNRAGVEATKTWLSLLLDAVARFDQVEGVTDAERDKAWKRILTAAKRYDVEVSESSWRELGKSGKAGKNGKNGKNGETSTPKSSKASKGSAKK